MTTTDPKTQADSLITRGRELLEQGELKAATDLLNQAVKLYWAAGEQYAAAAQIGNYGWALRRKGRPDLACPYLEQAATLFEQLGLKDFAERHRFAAEDAHAGVTPELLASLPTAVRSALEQGDVDGLQLALESLATTERDQVLERLVAAGVVSAGGDDERTDEALRQFEPLLQGIARVARGDQSERAEISATLADLERKGWRLRGPVEQIWAGERRPAALAQQLDALDQALLARMLALIADPAAQRTVD